MKNILIKDNMSFEIIPESDHIKINGSANLSVDDCEQVIDFLIEERFKIKRRLNAKKRLERNKLGLWERIFK
jgi:hypothetical protein